MRKTLFVAETICIVVLIVIICILLKGTIKEKKVAPIEESTDISIETLETQLPEEPETVQEETQTTQELQPVVEKQVDDNVSEDDYVDNGVIDVVVIGDSIWDDYRENNGVSEQIASLTGFKVYNCAVGGTSATITDSSTDVRTDWNNRSFTSMVYMLNGEIEKGSLLQGYSAYDDMMSADLQSVDYIIVSYGLNDYFSKSEVSTDDIYNLYTYEGAMRHGIMKLQKAFPKAKVLVISPTYCKVFDGKNQVGDSDTWDYGQGTLNAYVEKAREVANERNAYFLDAYHDFGMNAGNADVNLRDGVHFTVAGTTTYAQSIADFLLNVEKQ